jgi:putative FmdB family regulatory protein
MLKYYVLSLWRVFAVPLYEYECAKGHRFEKIEKFSASPVKKCPVCGGKAQRQISASSVQFKGSGWYVTDYGGKSTSGDGAKKDKMAAESKADAKAETKTESKPETKTEKSSAAKGAVSSEKKASSKAKE